MTDKKNPHQYPDHPRVGVMVVVVREDQVLLVQRSKEPHKGKWGLPGGSVEVGEKLFAAAVREVQEETGVTCEPFAFIDLKEEIHADAAGKTQYHYYGLVVGADWVAGEPVASDDAVAARWVKIADLPAASDFPDAPLLVQKTLLARAL